MWNQQQLYVAEKLRELEVERRDRLGWPDVDSARTPRVRGARPLAPAVRTAGRLVRAVGEAMERYASPAARPCEPM